jgi:hypothetical protein
MHTSLQGGDGAHEPRHASSWSSVLFSLRLMGLDLTVLSVFGGALGVGLGLGMQRIASNYVSGFIILLERSLSIGDPITVDKYSGRVARINTRYTTLRGARRHPHPAAERNADHRRRPEPVGNEQGGAPQHARHRGL